MIGFNITRYHNGKCESVDHNVKEYATEREAIEGARKYAEYWKYHFHAAMMNTELGAVLYYENGDDRRLIYYEIKKW